MDSDSDCYMMSEEEEESDYGFDPSDGEENVAPATKATKKTTTTTKKAAAAPAAKKKKAAAPSKKKAAAAAAASMDDDISVFSNSNAGNVDNNNNNKKTTTKDDKKSVEERYKKLTPIEHILVRPDTYIGSVRQAKEMMYILDKDERIVEQEIEYTPGLYKIFDEIVVNAADNKQRDPNMDKLEISIDPDENLLSVKNNGKGIPVAIHKEQNVYVPTMIFGQLLTGSNFDDNEKKTTGGRNGYGAKLANVFSKKFIVECVDSEGGLKFHQVFTDNMKTAHDPTVKKCSAAEKKAGDYVKISFSPDLEKFNMDRLDEATIGLLSKRAYDIAGTMSNSSGKTLKVFLNGKKLNVKSFKDYIDMYDGLSKPIIYAKDDRWEVAVGVSADGATQQISFVNSICTSKGGKHVQYIIDQLAAHLTKELKKKNKGGTDLKKNQVVSHLSVMINCLLDNPSFDSQTKDSLNLAVKEFGTKFQFQPALLKKLEKSDLSEKILSFALFKADQALKRKGGVKRVKLTGIAKLDDANHAGSAKSKDCTLIVTEGDSAKSLAVAGISVVGRDYYGVFPLRGKLKNVRDLKKSEAVNNEEIKNLVDIIGLKYGTVYDETNIKTLRYGHLMIMADQDTDGSHIKGLVINFFHAFWPSLLDVPGFMQQFITPIVKVTKKPIKNNKSRSFFNLHEYKQWLESTGNNGANYNIKYYKGLGTSTSEEAKEYFSNLDVHEIMFQPLSRDLLTTDEEENEVVPDTVESGSDLIDMVFRKTRVEDRKTWLNGVARDEYLDYAAMEDGCKYSDFINKEFAHFSLYDVYRSIPSCIDGFKPSQRKVLFGCIKKKMTQDRKVAELCGYVGEHSAYHHGETSLQGTIVNMAQTFVGSNNINLLTPAGQFGTRRMGGKDHASARYIFTNLEPIARAIYHPDDDELLNYLEDDGTSIEPEYYVPVIPMTLVNGADGIGTGWSTKVCNYNPRDIIANLRHKIAGEEVVPMHPYYHGFVGEFERKSKGKYTHAGKLERVDDTTIVITELPLKVWTQDYRDFLEKMIIGDAKANKPPEITDLKENHTETTVSFTITCKKADIDAWEKGKGLNHKFKMTGNISATNMMLFDKDGRITRYDSPEEILDAFYDVRLEFYDKRKEHLVRKMEEAKKILSNKARFVEEVCKGELIVSNRKRKDILADLQHRGYYLVTKENKKSEGDEEDDEDEQDSFTDDEPKTADLAKGYEYLLGMKIWSLTFEKAEELRRQLEAKIQELEALLATPPSQLWLDDLDTIENILDDRDEENDKTLADEKRAQKKAKKHQTNAAKKKNNNQSRKKKKKDEWDSDMETDSDDGKMEAEDSDDSFTFQAKPNAKSKPQKAKVSARAKKVESAAPVPKNITLPTSSQIAKRPASPPAAADESDDDMDVEVSLVDRMMKKKLMVSPPTKKQSSNSSADTKKRTSPRVEDLEDEMSSDKESVEHAKPKPVKAKRGAKTAAAKKAPPKKSTKNKKGMSSDEGDMSSEDFGMSSDDDVAPVASTRTAPSRSRRAQQKKPAKYVYSSDEEESDDEFDFE